MDILQFTAPGHADIRTVPTPDPAAGEVLVRVMEVNTCPQWDLHLWRGEQMLSAPLVYPYTPGQPGHEMAGVVAAVGAGVTGFRVGDRVAAWKDPGHQRQGCYAQYVCFDPFHLLPIPGARPFAEYASLELAMCVGASFLDILQTTPLNGLRVGVSGLGGAGLIAAQLARAEGAVEVVGFEPNPERAELARNHGVDRVYDPVTNSPEEVGGNRVDVALDCVGSKASAEFLLAITRHIVAIFGVQREPFLYPCANRKLKLFGYPGHSREAAEYALARIDGGQLSLEGLVGARLPLGEYARGVQLLLDQKVIKVCYLPNG